MPQVLLNGLPLGQTFQRHSAYVPQEDIFVPTLSAWETLQVCTCIRALHFYILVPVFGKQHAAKIYLAVGKVTADHAD